MKINIEYEKARKELCFQLVFLKLFPREKQKMLM